MIPVFDLTTYVMPCALTRLEWFFKPFFQLLIADCQSCSALSKFCILFMSCCSGYKFKQKCLEFRLLKQTYWAPNFASDDTKHAQCPLFFCFSGYCCFFIKCHCYLLINYYNIVIQSYQSIMFGVKMIVIVGVV